MAIKILSEMRDTFRNFVTPKDHPYVLRLRSCGVHEEDIQPLIKDLHIILKGLGMYDTIDTLITSVCLVYAKGVLTNDDAKMIMSSSLMSLISEFTEMYHEPKDVIMRRVKWEGIPVSDFRKAIKMRADQLIKR